MVNEKKRGRAKERNASLCFVVCQVSIFTRRRRRENRDHTGRVMVMICSGFLYSSFLQQLVSAWYVNRHNGIWVWLNVNASRRKARVERGGKRKKCQFLRIRDVACSELSGFLPMQEGHWLVSHYRTAKVVLVPADQAMTCLWFTP